MGKSLPRRGITEGQALVVVGHIKWPQERFLWLEPGNPWGRSRWRSELVSENLGRSNRSLCSLSFKSSIWSAAMMPSRGMGSYSSGEEKTSVVIGKI